MLDTNSTTDLTVSKDFKLVRFVSQLLVDQLTGKYAIDGFQRQWALFRQSIAPSLKQNTFRTYPSPSRQLNGG